MKRPVCKGSRGKLSIFLSNLSQNSAISIKGLAKLAIILLRSSVIQNLEREWVKLAISKKVLIAANLSWSYDNVKRAWNDKRVLRNFWRNETLKHVVTTYVVRKLFGYFQRLCKLFAKRLPIKNSLMCIEAFVAWFCKKILLSYLTSNLTESTSDETLW